MLGGYNLNQQADAEDNDAQVEQDNVANGFADGPQSAISGNASNTAEEAGEEITSQPVVPFVGQIFGHIDEAKELYNEYAFKMGFGTRIGNTKYSQAKNAPKDTILRRVFECVHTGRPTSEKQGSSSKTGVAALVNNAATDMSIHTAQKSRSKQAVEQMDVSDTRQRNKLLRHGCKAHMIVGMRQGAWTVTVFNAEHTHPLVKQVGRHRYYRSHRKVPEEDF